MKREYHTQTTIINWFSEGTEYTKAFVFFLRELQENMNKQQTSTMPLTSDEWGDDFLTVEDEYTRQARKDLEEFRSRSTVKEPRQVTTVQGAVKVTSDNVPNELSLCQEELRRSKEENRRLVEENKRLKAAINCLITE